MKITFAVPTLNGHKPTSPLEGAPRLERLLQSVYLGSTVRPDEFLVVDNAVEKFWMSFSPAQYHRPGKNIGVAASWNYFMRNAKHTHVLISNDDIVVEPETIERMVACAEAGAQMVCAEPDSAWSFFLQSKELFSKVGPYDENFWPAYFEDNDYRRRMHLLGYDPVTAPGAKITHAKSSTIAAMSRQEREAFDREFALNERYYRRKWGGTPGHETLTVPSKAERG